jgi:PadR family transcriptional regulator PadR
MLTRNEEILLLAVWKLQPEAYGLSVCRHVAKLMGAKVSVGAVYIPLERLVQKGCLATWESEPTAKRGGRRKRFYRLTREGLAALSAVKQLHDQAWAGVPEPAVG